MLLTNTLFSWPKVTTARVLSASVTRASMTNRSDAVSENTSVPWLL